MLEKVPRDVASRCWPDAGVDVDGTACPLHHPTTCRCQMMGHVFLPSIILSRRVAVGGGALLGDAKPPSLDICEGVDRLGTCVIEFYTERIAFTRICLPYVGIIMVCMCVPLVELPSQTVMGRIPLLEYTVRCMCVPAVVSYFVR
jgi:hypothetical protein